MCGVYSRGSVVSLLCALTTKFICVEHLKESARLSQSQVSLDRAQDEIQLMKLSLSEKDTQLLKSQDHHL